MRATSVLLIFLSALASGDPPPGTSMPVAPDLLFFAEKLAPEIHTRCAGCHSDPEMAGSNFLLTPLDDLAAPDTTLVRRNFRAVLRFLDPLDPGKSPLLDKVVGGAGHGGGAILGRASRDYGLFEAFALGATLANRPPQAIVGRRVDVEAGAEAGIDGSLSGDPDGDALVYRWRAVEHAPGGALEVEAGGERARITASRAGVYRLELAVFDGRLWSLPASVLIVASRPPAPAADGTAKPGSRAMETPPAKPLVDRRLDPARLRLIRRMFLDLMWRTPRLDEIERWYGRSHEEMVDAFLQDEQVWDTWYERQLFYFLLLDQFRPRDHVVATIPSRLADGSLSAPRALEEIVRSQFFNARNPGNDTYVTVVLEQCLGLVVQERKNTRLLELGKKMYDGYRTKLFGETGDSQADFVRIVFRQPGCFEHILARMWRELHGDDIDGKRLALDAGRLADDAGAFRAILREWLTGPAYVRGAGTARTKDEIPYVRGLFMDLLDRTPSYEELRNVRNAFLSLADPTPIRLVMGRVLLHSDQARMPASAAGDAERFVKEQFLRLFARQASEEERKAFVTALESDPRVTPRVVLWTLISSPEYQTY